MRHVAFLVIMLSAGCFAPSVVVQFGDLEIVSTRATSDYDIRMGQAAALLTVTLRGNETGRVAVSGYVVHEPCPTGPTGAPETWLARADGGFDEFGPTPTSHTITLEWSASVPPGSRYSIRSSAEGEHTIGPIFGTCQTFLAGAS